MFVAPESPSIILVGGKDLHRRLRPSRGPKRSPITGEWISAVGTTDSIRRLAGKATRVIELNGAVVVPGFNDAHDHVSGEPPPTFLADLAPLPDPTGAVVLDSVRAVAARLPQGTLITTYIGTRILGDQAVRRAALDRAAPNHPVLLLAWSGHGTIANSAGLQAFGVTDSSADPLGGHIDRDARGAPPDSFRSTPSGARSMHRGPAGASRRAHRRHAGGASIRRGVRNHEHPEFFQRRHARHVAARCWRTRTLADPLPADGDARDDPGQAGSRRRGIRLRSDPAVGSRVSGLKYVVDGTPVEGLAFMRQPYADGIGHGRLNFPVDTIRAILRGVRHARHPAADPRRG